MTTKVRCDKCGEMVEYTIGWGSQFLCPACMKGIESYFTRKNAPSKEATK